MSIKLLADKVHVFEEANGFKTDSLLDVMLLETAGSLNPAITNPTSSATGLFQFMPSTAIDLGTSVSQLRNMTFDQQLVYCLKYLTKYGYDRKIKSTNDPLDVYLAIFFPLAMGKPDSYVLETSKLSAFIIAKQNPLYDVNKDKKITKGEIRKKFAVTVKSIREKKGLPRTMATQLNFDLKLLLIPLGLWFILS